MDENKPPAPVVEAPPVPVTQEQLNEVKQQAAEAVKKMNELFQERAALNARLAESEMARDMVLNELHSVRAQPSEMDRLAADLDKAKLDGNEAEQIRLTALLTIKANEVAGMKQSISMAKRHAMALAANLNEDEKSAFYNELFVGGDPRGRLKSMESMQSFLDDPDGFLENVQGKQVYRQLKSGVLENKIRERIAAEEVERQKQIQAQVGITTGNPALPVNPDEAPVKPYSEQALDEILAAGDELRKKLPHQTLQE